MSSHQEKEAKAEQLLQSQKGEIVKFIDHNKLGHIVKFQDRS